jgi:hypothetical protein
MFKDFDISKFKKMKPPGDNSFATMQETKDLKKIPLNKKFVKDNDDIEAVFKQVALIAKKLIKHSAPVIIELKKHFNRSRPKVLAKKLTITMKDYEMDSMKTPSYPSGHSTQAVLIGNVLADKYPKASKAFKKAAQNISYSRNVAKAHYKSDSKMGEKLGKEMYNYIKKNNGI